MVQGNAIHALHARERRVDASGRGLAVGNVLGRRREKPAAAALHYTLLGYNWLENAIEFLKDPLGAPLGVKS